MSQQAFMVFQERYVDCPEMLRMSEFIFNIYYTDKANVE